MARKKASHLSLLMRELSISGNALAEYLSVDGSLVSKWRNGSRKVNVEYLKKITKLALSMDVSANYQRICRISGLPMHINHDAAQVEKYLQVWLAAVEEPEASGLHAFDSKQGKQINGYIFLGENAKREAVEIYLDYSSQGEGQDIWLYSDQGSDWLFKDGDYRFEWQNKNFALLEKNKVHIIHPIFKDYRHVAEYMVRWLPLHMYGDTEAGYIPQYQLNTFESTICLTKDTVALVSMTTNLKVTQTVSYLLSDQGSLQSVQNILASLMVKSKPLFQRFSYHDNELYFKMYRKFANKKTRGMYFGGGPPQCLIPMANLQTFINESDYTYDERQQYQRILQSICYESTVHSGIAPITVIIHLDQLSDLLRSKYCTMRTLSYCMGKPVYICQVQFRQCLMAVLDIAEQNESVRLFLSDHSVFHPHADIDMFIREREIASFTSMFYCEGNQERNLTIAEEAVVSALFHNMDYYAQTHPNRGMRISDVRLRIKELFDRYKIDDCIDESPHV